MINNNLNMESRVWVYQSNRPFTDAEAQAISERVKEFVGRWTSHKIGVEGDGGLFYNRFILLMADESAVKVGGCSIDSSVHFIKALEKEFNTSFFDRWNIAYKKDNEVQSCNRSELENLENAGIITDDTIVFNNLITTKQQLLNEWEVPFKQSWLKNLPQAHNSFNAVL